MNKHICPICKEENFDKNNFGICNNCLKSISGNGRYLLHCHWCNEYWKSNHNFRKHDKCGKISIKKICNQCKQEFWTHSSRIEFCKNCGIEFNKSDSVKLYDRLSKLPDSQVKEGFLLIPIDYNDEFNTYGKIFQEKKCSWCDRTFKPYSPFQTACGKCFKINVCKTCGNKFIRCRKLENNIPYGPRNEKSSYCSLKCNSVNAYQKSLANLWHIPSTNINTNQSNKFEIENFQEITKENCIDFNNLSGVWFKYDPENNIVLDVCLTKNILKEYNWGIEALKNPPNKKYKELSKLNNIQYFYLCSIDSWQDGLEKELNFAIKTNAKYWKPSPGYQAKKIKEANYDTGINK